METIANPFIDQNLICPNQTKTSKVSSKAKTGVPPPADPEEQGQGQIMITSLSLHGSVFQLKFT